MHTPRRNSGMIIPTLIMATIAVILLVLGYQRGNGEHIIGVKSGIKVLIEIFPLLIFSLIVAGMIQILLPKELLSKWVGTESGMRGILIGAFAGSLTPGGPYVTLPIVSGLLRSGASVGTTVAFLTGWSLWAFSRLPIEMGIVGWKFALVRLASTFIFPPLAGLIAQLFFSGTRLT